MAIILIILQFGTTMSAALVSVATALLAGGVINTSVYEELKDEAHSLTSRTDKLVTFVKGKCSKDCQDLADILEANKEQYGDSEAFKALQQIVDSTQSTSGEYHISILNLIVSICALYHTTS